MFQSALLYLQQIFPEAIHFYEMNHAPSTVIGQQQSTRACQFLQYSFSLLFAVVRQAFRHLQRKK
jgi:hypothetical protein